VRLLLALALVAPAWAATYYVSNQGSNGNSGRSPDSAFATLQHAADLVAAGDSVLVLDGDYVGFDLRTAGTASAPILFSALGDSGRVTARNRSTADGINVEDAAWVVIQGFKVKGIQRAGIRVAVSANVTVRGNLCDSNGMWGIFTGFADSVTIEDNVCSRSQTEHGIYHSNSADYPLIRHNVSHHNRSCGIHMNGDSSMGGDGLISHATVEGNVIYENGRSGGSGINCDGVADSRIFNNLLYLNHAGGISLYCIDASAGSYNTKVYNNTVVNAADARWCLNINTASYADSVYNNVLYTFHTWRGSICIDSSSRPGFASDNNVLVDRLSTDGGSTTMPLTAWQALGYDTHSFLAQPESIFRDWPAGDFHLRPSSPARDGGTDAVAGVVLDDLDGVPRPQGPRYDIGAYELPVSGCAAEPVVRPSPSTASIVWASLFVECGPNPGWLLDVCGRKVMELAPRANDIRHLAPGIYYVRQAPDVEHDTPSVAKVVVQH
jgi:parallel beta-helix repeat protein